MFKKKFGKFFSLLVTFALLFNSFAAPILTSAQENGDGGGNPGAIWTTKNDCGDLAQDVNHFDQGEGVFVNGSGFDPGDYSWEIKGKPGGASGDPDTVVASGVETVDDTGSFCIDDPDPAYTIAPDDWGEYGVKFGDKGDNYQVDREIPEGPGSVTVCKVILDPADNVVDGSERPGAEFSVSWDGSDAPIGPSSFTTPLSLNTSLFSDNADGECITYGQLPIGNYYYGEESYPGAGWEVPLYNDFFDPQATGLGDFTPYFDREDPNRNMNSDGHVVLTDGRPHRTLAILNQYQRIPDPTQIIVHKVTNPQDDGQTEFGVTLFDDTDTQLSREQVLTTSSDVVFNVEPGVYHVNETGVPGGWSETRNSCGPRLEVRPEQTVECTILNTRLGSITVDKVTDPEGHDQEFEFTLSQRDRHVNVSLADGDDPHTFPNLPPGTFSLSEVQVQGWDLTSALCTNGEERFDPRDGFELLPGGQIRCVFENTLKRGSIYGYKYEDGDGNLQTTGDWTPVENWLVELFERINEQFQPTGQTDTTDSNGLYFFTNLLPGEYGVKEQMQPGWDNLTDKKIGPINLEPGEREGEHNFVNVRLSDVHGFKWNDRNGNGQQDGEELLGGWSIGIFKYDGDGGWDTIDSMVTQEGGGHHGWYWFNNLLPGKYKICERLKPGWTQTFPTEGRIPGCHIVNLPDENPQGLELTENAVPQPEPAYSFGNYEKGSITVIKNLDSDGDGEMDIFRTDRFTWTINGRGEFKTGDTHPLPAGVYLIAENQMPGYHETGFSCIGKRVVDHSVLITPGEDVVCIFENTRDTGSVWGKKWNDLNGNGAQDDEPYLEGWTIELYKNGLLVDTSITDGAGNFSFIGVPTGDYKICEVVQPGWDQTYPTGNNGCHDITILNDQSQKGIKFGNWERIFDVSIEKSNDKPDPTYAGDTVNYTLVMTNNGNRIVFNPQIVDALPGGFTYVAGSTVIDGISPQADPAEVDGKLVWDLPLLALKPQTTLTLEYQAITSDELVDGIYTNLATCKAKDRAEDILESIRGLPEINWIECNIDDSSVAIGSVLDISAGVEPQVLGIKTELPAAGSDTELMMGIMLAGALGFVFKLVSKKLYEEDN